MSKTGHKNTGENGGHFYSPFGWSASYCFFLGAGKTNYREIFMNIIMSIIIALLVGIIASIIASNLWSKRQEKQRLERNKKNFEGLAGKYHHYKINGEIMEGKQSVITYEPPHVLRIVTTTKRKHNWKGQIIMDELIPSYGVGRYLYDYPDKEVWGMIYIQIIPESKDILVHAIDTSQEEEKKVSYIMEKYSD